MTKSNIALKCGFIENVVAGPVIVTGHSRLVAAHREIHDIHARIAKRHGAHGARLTRCDHGMTSKVRPSESGRCIAKCFDLRMSRRIATGDNAVHTLSDNRSVCVDNERSERCGACDCAFGRQFERALHQGIKIGQLVGGGHRVLSRLKGTDYVGPYFRLLAVPP